MDILWQDFKYGMRMLFKNPGFTATAVLVLALGIGVNSAAFSLVNALVLRPLAAHKPEELVSCYSKNTKLPGSYRAFSYPNYCDIREKNTVFTSVTAHNLAMVGISEGDNTRRVFADVVASNYFSTFGVHVFRGREFLPAEEQPGSNIRVAIVSYNYWSRMGADPDLIGKTLRIDGQTFTIVGITAAGFTGSMAMMSPDLWLPLGVHDRVINYFDSRRMPLNDRRNHCLYLVGRVRPGLTPAAVDAQLAVFGGQMEKAFPAENKDQTLFARRVERLSVSTSPNQDKGLAGVSVLLMSMAAVVLLIACLNLANMMLARGTARRKEFAIRFAVGGSRSRVLRQLFTESLMLSLLGGAAGLFLAQWATNLLVSSFTRLVPLSMDFHGGADPRVLAATVVFCVLSVFVFALGPAWKLSRPDVVDNLKEQAGQDARGGNRYFVFGRRNLLVVGQIALSLTLVVAAGLFIRGGYKAAQVDLGFSLDNEVIVDVDPGLAGYDEARGRELYRALLERMERIPGVEAASLAATVPMGMINLGCSVRRSDAKSAEESRSSSASASLGLDASGGSTSTAGTVGAVLNVIGADYFKVLGLRVLQGRPFSRTEAESTSASRVAIIDETLARKLWPEGNALGNHIQFMIDEGGGGKPVSMEVVGVVPSVRDNIFGPAVRMHVYLPFGRRYQSNMNIHLRLAGRGAGNEAALLQTIRREIRSLDDRLPVLSIRTFYGHVDESLSLWLVRAGARMFTVFGALALFLAVVGVYGLKAYTVARRTREIGIRVALGATSHSTLWLILREGLAMTVVGVGIGMLLAVVMGKLLTSMLYEVSGTDPLILTVAPAVLAAASLAACYLPAHRAARIDPMVALRQE